MEKRKQIIVNPKVQLKLIALIVFVALLPIMGLFIGFMMYTARLLGEVPADNSTMIQLIESVQKLNFMTFGGFVFILILLAVVETLFLHKIIGPLYRMETDLEEILNTKNFAKKIKIRENDYIHSLVEKINRLISCVKE